MAPRNKHVVMLDMDNATLKGVKNVASKLILRYKLSNIYVIESSPKKYHLISLDIVDIYTLKRIVSDFADPTWVKWRLKAQKFVLRISKKKTKPKLMMCISGYGRRLKSNAHRLLLEAIYGINIKKDNHFDNNTVLELHVYRTKEGR